MLMVMMLANSDVFCYVMGAMVIEQCVSGVDQDLVTCLFDQVECMCCCTFIMNVTLPTTITVERCYPCIVFMAL